MQETHTLVIQQVRGFGPRLRADLRDALDPFPAAPGSTVAISKMIASANFRPGTYIWATDDHGGLAEKIEQRFTDQTSIQRLIGRLDFELNIGGYLRSWPMNSPNLEYNTSARTYEMICLKQGVVYFAKNPVQQLEKMARRQRVKVLTDEMVRAIFEIAEGKNSSNHERLELIRSATAFLNALLARDYAASPGLNHSPIRLRVQAPA